MGKKVIIDEIMMCGLRYNRTTLLYFNEEGNFVNFITIIKLIEEKN